MNPTEFNRSDLSFSEHDKLDDQLAEATIPELEREGKLGTFDPCPFEEFAPVTFQDYLHPDQAAELKAGDIVYPERWNRVIVSVHETSVLSRARP